jgi:hypothetical protein
MFKTIFLDGMVTVAVNRGIDKETAIPLMKKYLVKIDTNDELIQSMGSAYFALRVLMYEGYIDNVPF